MVRDRKRTTDRGKGLHNLALAKQAVDQGRSVRSAAQDFDLCHVTLARYCKKADVDSSDKSHRFGYNPHNRVFSSENERILVKYLKSAAEIFYGLTPKDVRQLAYECAVKHKLWYPDAWNESKMAGRDWFTGFMKRNSTLTLRKPQATSLARATSFNKTTVSEFFDNLSNVLGRFQFPPHDIYNMDETGITTVQRPSHIVAEKGTKQVGALTSQERGTLVTCAVAINATGNSIPPMLIFPRKNFKDHFIRDGPPGCTGTANGSGWMQEDDFLVFLMHFHKHTKPSLEKPVLLILDNHESHRSIKSLDFCKDKGIVLLSLPPHTSHKLQPLDRTVFGPLKRATGRCCDSWMMNHPGQTMTIYNIPEILREALPLAITQNNVISGFRCTGIVPLNRDVFQEIEYAPSQVTDRVDPSAVPAVSTQQETGPGTSTLQETGPGTSGTSIRQETGPGTSTRQETGPDTDGSQFSPVAVKPFPKAGPRKQQKGGRKRKKSEILTDTPVKAKLTEEKLQAKEKKKPKPKRLTFKKKKTVQYEDDSDSEMNICLVCCDSFTNSLPGEEWLQCSSCKFWAHEDCTPKQGFYICQNCQSDDEDC